jgi:hypothetical protein
MEGATSSGMPPQGASSSSKPMEGASSSGIPKHGASNSNKPMQGATSSGIPPQGASSSSKPMEGASISGIPKHGASNSNKPMEGATSSGIPPQGASSSNKPMEGASSTGTPPQGASSSNKPMEWEYLRFAKTYTQQRADRQPLVGCHQLLIHHLQIWQQYSHPQTKNVIPICSTCNFSILWELLLVYYSGTNVKSRNKHLTLIWYRNSTIQGDHAELGLHLSDVSTPFNRQATYEHISAV